MPQDRRAAIRGLVKKAEKLDPEHGDEAATNESTRFVPNRGARGRFVKSPQPVEDAENLALPQEVSVDPTVKVDSGSAQTSPRFDELEALIAATNVRASNPELDQQPADRDDDEYVESLELPEDLDEIDLGDLDEQWRKVGDKDQVDEDPQPTRTDVPVVGIRPRAGRFSQLDEKLDASQLAVLDGFQDERLGSLEDLLTKAEIFPVAWEVLFDTRGAKVPALDQGWDYLRYRQDRLAKKQERQEREKGGQMDDRVLRRGQDRPQPVVETAEERLQKFLDRYDVDGLELLLDWPDDDLEEMCADRGMAALTHRRLEREIRLKRMGDQPEKGGWGRSQPAAPPASTGRGHLNLAEELVVEVEPTVSARDRGKRPNELAPAGTGKSPKGPVGQLWDWLWTGVVETTEPAPRQQTQVPTSRSVPAEPSVEVGGTSGGGLSELLKPGGKVDWKKVLGPRKQS